MPDLRPSRLALAAAIAFALAAGPALAYTVYLKDGSKIVASEKYKVRGEKAIVKLTNGTETMLPLAEIDVARTEKSRRRTTKGPTVRWDPSLCLDTRVRAYRSVIQREFTSSGMPGPNVVDTAPFWM